MERPGEMKKQSAGRRVRREKIRRKKMQVREKVGKSRNTVFFRGFVAPEGWKVGSLKRRVRRDLGRWEMKSCTPLWREAHLEVKCVKNTRFGPLLEVEMSKKCTPLWREAHFEVKMYKTHHCRTTFGSWDVEKVHAVVARSTFPSQNVQSTPGSDHFWKSKCTKHTRPLLEVEMSKKCTPLWREAHFEVKMYKTPHVRATFGGSDVEKVHAVVARSTFRSQNVQNTPLSDHFWKLRCRKSARRCGAKHISKSKCTKHHMFAPLLEVQMSKKCTPLWREAHFEVKMYKTLGVRTTFGGSDVASLRFGSLHYTIHSTTLQYITLHYTPQHYNYNYRTTQLHSTTLHYIKLQYTTPHYTTLHYTTLHYTTLYTLHYTTLHYTTLYTPHTTVHYTTLHSTTLQLQLQNYTTTLHYTPLHTATLNYTTLHYTTLERSIDR